MATVSLVVPKLAAMVGDAAFKAVRAELTEVIADPIPSTIKKRIPVRVELLLATPRTVPKLEGTVALVARRGLL